jgi:uncharacterized membrane protein
MAKIGTWKIHPIKNEIILTLIRHKGEMLDTDLLRILQNQYVDINKSGLSRILFNLEVQMLIDVQRLRKNVNKIALRKDAPISEFLKKIIK